MNGARRMPRVSLGVTLVALMLAQAAPAATPAVTPSGIGAARIGMTVAEAEAALGVDLRPLRDRGGAGGRCGLLYPDGLPGRYALLVVDGVLARVDVASRRVRTADGLGVASTELAVRSRYGEAIEIRPHEHIPDGHYLNVALPDGLWLVFESNGEIILSYRLGRLPEVRQRAPCD